MASGNPYNKINPLDFIFRRVGEYKGRALFILKQSENSAFDMCVFRRYLFDFLMDGLTGDFTLKNRGNDYQLELDAGWDEAVLRHNFRVV